MDLQFVIRRNHYGYIYSSGYASKRKTREQSSDSIQKQLTAFERLLQHAMSRFSKDNLYNVLRHVTRWKEKMAQPQHKHATKIMYKLHSVAQLRELMKAMKSDTSRNSSDDDRLYKNYELFMNDLLYLRDLKKYFDDEIYKSLLKYHYDASIVSPVKAGTKYKTKTGRYVKIEDEDSGHGSPAEIEMSKVTSGSGTLDRKQPARVSDKESEEKYRQTVKDLESILNKWEGLMSDEAPDLNFFDPDSYHELTQFSNYSQFETVLRLVPDIFAKCYKCIELAKTWLQQSNIVLKDVPEISSPSPSVTLTIPRTASTPISNATDPKQAQTENENNQQLRKELLANIRDLQNQIVDIDKSIEDDKKQLEDCNLEMDRLVEREERYTSVTSEFNKIDSLITIAAGDLQKSRTEQYAVANKLKNYSKGTQAYDEIKSNLKKLDTEVLQNHTKMNFLKFEKATVQEDYLVELEVRPEFIRFLGDTKDKIIDLERFLESKKEEKVRLEKQLALTKTNTERMKKIMNTYLGSEEKRSSPDVVMGKSPSPVIPKNAWTGSDVKRVSADGNEADVDSPVPEMNITFEITPPSTGRSSVGRLSTGRPSTGESDTNILQKPTIVKKVRDIRPSSDGTKAKKDNKLQNSAVISAINKKPKASLKTQPKRVWENF